MRDLLSPTEAYVLEIGRAALRAEADAIRLAASRLGSSFVQAVNLILKQKNKIIIMGVGKSGQVAAKIAATFCSTGIPAFFLPPAEALHGGLGIYSLGDPTLLISKSGATDELIQLLPSLRRLQSPLIAILGNLESPLARQVTVVLDARVNREAEPLNLAPTSSSTVALAIGDALAAALVTARGFSSEDFAALHPQGQLGRNLWLSVADVMHGLEKVACVQSVTALKEVVICMTQFPLGAACVLDEQNQLLGIITDGDVRRALQKYDDIRFLSAEQVMMSNPLTIAPEAALAVAVDRMERRASQISVLPVVDSAGRCLGLLRIHDIYQADLR